jgi:UDP:flavonoid glycosyltransferase YjiC (YdhE family)
MISARVVCVTGGFTKQQLEPLPRKRIRLTSGPIDLEPQLDADLCITYGAEGTTMRFLIAGTPQFVSPWHVETFMAVRRIELGGLGFTLRGPRDAIAESNLRAANDAPLRQQVGAFAQRNTATQRPEPGLQVCDIVNQAVQFKCANRSAVPNALTAPTAEMA